MTRNDLDSEVVNLHVDILKPPRGKKTFSTWRRNETSEESNDTSEESNETSEVFFLLHVENKKEPRGDLRFLTGLSVEAVTSCDALLTYAMIWAIGGEVCYPLTNL